MGISQNYGYLFGGPNNKGYSILGSILGYPNFGKQPYILYSYMEPYGSRLLRPVREDEVKGLWFRPPVETCGGL